MGLPEKPRQQGISSLLLDRCKGMLRQGLGLPLDDIVDVFEPKSLIARDSGTELMKGAWRSHEANQVGEALVVCDHIGQGHRLA